MAAASNAAGQLAIHSILEQSTIHHPVEPTKMKWKGITEVGFVLYREVIKSPWRLKLILVQ